MEDNVDFWDGVGAEAVLGGCRDTGKVIFVRVGDDEETDLLDGGQFDSVRS